MFGLYIFLVLDTLFFSKFGVNMRGINLIPFRTMTELMSHPSSVMARLILIGNILMFIPMGIYIKCFFLKDSLLIGILKLSLISLAIKIFQYILAVGIADVDDIILNVLGGMIGWMVCFFLYKIQENKDHLLLSVATLSLLFGLPVVGFVFIVHVYNGMI